MWDTILSKHTQLQFAVHPHWGWDAMLLPSAGRQRGFITLSVAAAAILGLQSRRRSTDQHPSPLIYTGRHGRWDRTSRLDESGECSNSDCMRAFNACWFFGVEEGCKDDVTGLVGFSRQRSRCFDRMFWTCLERFANHLTAHYIERSRRAAPRPGQAFKGGSTDMDATEPSPVDVEGECVRRDCARAFDACWFFGVESGCRADKATLVGFQRQRSPCFDDVFWGCIQRFSQAQTEATRHSLW